jgi:hypothetical protein
MNGLGTKIHRQATRVIVSVGSDDLAAPESRVSGPGNRFEMRRNTGPIRFQTDYTWVNHPEASLFRRQTSVRSRVRVDNLRGAVPLDRAGRPPPALARLGSDY